MNWYNFAILTCLTIFIITYQSMLIHLCRAPPSSINIILTFIMVIGLDIWAFKTGSKKKEEE